MPEYDLPTLIMDTMGKMGFRQSSINLIAGSTKVAECQGLPTHSQRTILIMMFYDILMYKPGIKVPNQIRIGLSAADDSLTWFDDIVRVVLPYMRELEDIFFPIN